MTAQELAASLDGVVSYGNEVDNNVRENAIKNGLVIVYGASDDLMEFDGAIQNEADVWGGGVVLVSRKGLHRPPDMDCEAQNCPYYRKSLEGCKTIKAVWCGRNKAAAWTYETDIPHAEFRVFEDGDIECVGIIFSIDDLPE